MAKSFKVGDFVKISDSRGVEFAKGVVINKRRDYKNRNYYTISVINGKGQCTSNISTHNKQLSKYVPSKTIFNKLLKISDSYLGEINYKGKQLKVGCQNISFDTIIELHKRIINANKSVRANR